MKTGFQKKWQGALAIALGLALGSVGIMAARQWPLRLNSSPSAPHWLYRLQRDSMRFKPGDWVSIRDFNIASDYIPQTDFIKRIAAGPGDQVEVNGDWLWVNQLPLATLKPYTKDGRPLTPIAKQRLAAGQFLVIGLHADSFDSRYNEFGLVGAEHIEGRVSPII